MLVAAFGLTCKQLHRKRSKSLEEPDEELASQRRAQNSVGPLELEPEPELDDRGGGARAGAAVTRPVSPVSLLGGSE